MNKENINPSVQSDALTPFLWLFRWRTVRRILVAAAGLATLVALFYSVENWRGKRAWTKCKRELEAKGAVLDWAAYIPPPVPDDQNVFKAAGISEAFVKLDPSAVSVRSSSELSQRLSDLSALNQLSERHHRTEPVTVAEVTVVSPAENSAAGKSDVLLSIDDTTAREKAAKLVGDVLGNRLPGAQGPLFIARPWSDIKVAHVRVVAQRPPTSSDIAALFPTWLGPTGVGDLRVKPGPSSNSFRVLLIRSSVYSAADYLAWSDQFIPDFDRLSETLQRPHARIDCDYQRAFMVLIPNYVTIRMVAQTLAQRAQCHLLLDQPELALRDLSLLGGLHRLVDAKPITLVSAMIDVAINGLYTDIIAEGLRLKSWREPQLTALQAQLREINLVPLFADSVSSERAGVVRLFEFSSRAELMEVFDFRHEKTSLWQKFHDPSYLLLRFAPRGWRYQNMTALATLDQILLENLDPVRGLVSPRELNIAKPQMEALVNGSSPYTFMAALAMPNFVKAAQVLAFNQNKANQELVVCALERHRLSQGNYPGQLAALVPKFLDRLPPDLINGEPLKYRLKDNDRFILYSLGWNGTDEGGVPGRTTDGKSIDRTTGDWVWDAPAQ